MTGAFSMLPLAALIRSRHTVAAVLVAGNPRDTPALISLPAPAPAGDLPLSGSFWSRTIIDLAWANGIPLYRLHDPSARWVADWVHDLGADVGCIACFDRLIRDPLRSVPRLGFLNVHPSLLPAYRGPAPLFWTFRDGVGKTGVTIHRVDAGMDTGPILTQAPLTLADGLTGIEVDRLAAAMGGELLVQALDGLADGTITPRPQPEGGWTNPHPQPADFRLELTWSARRAFNFMRGAMEWDVPFTVDMADQTLSLAWPLAYNEDARQSAPVIRDGDTVSIQFTPGTLRAVVGTR